MSATAAKPSRSPRQQPALPPPRRRFRLLIIDRYLLRHFLKTFLICFCSLTGLYVLIDGMGNFEEFVNYGQTHGGVLAVMGKYYAFQSLAFFDTTSSLLALIAAMFTVTWIQRHNEMTALASAGIRKARVIKPVFVAGIVVSLLAVANREFVVPRCRSQLSHNAQDLGGASGKPLRPRYDNATDVLFGGAGSKTFADTQRIDKPDFYLPPGLDRYGARLTAESAFYRPAEDGRPAGYLFTHVESPADLAGEASLAVGDTPILLSPKDHPWLKPDECFVVSDVSFEHLEGGGAGWRQYSSTAELITGLRNRSLEFGAGERAIIHARLVQPLLDLTLLFLGMPLMLSRSNRNVFLAIGMCLGIVVAFMLVVMGCKYLGSGYWIEPALAAWLPLMVFVPCAVWLSPPLYE